MKVILLLNLTLFVFASEINAQKTYSLLGSKWTGKLPIFNSLNISTKTFTEKDTIRGIQYIIQGENTFDQANNLYFFQSNLGISQINSQDGAIIKTFANSVKISGIEYDSNKIFGIYWKGKNVIFTSMDILSNKFTDIGVLNNLEEFAQGESTFDEVHKQYFIKSKFGIHIVNALTAASDTIPNSKELLAIEYDRGSNSLIGVTMKGSNLILTTIDVSTRKFTYKGVLKGVNQVAQGESCFDPIQKIYFIKTNLGITLINTQNASIVDTISDKILFASIEVSSSLEKKRIQLKEACLNDSAFFTISDTSGLDSVRWNFGDTLSREKNISKKITKVYHIYTRSEEYKTRVIFYIKNKQDTAYLKFKIEPFIKPYIGHDTVICNLFEMVLNPRMDYAKYAWNTHHSTKAISINTKGIYFLNVIDSNGCKGSDTIVIQNPITISDFSISDSIQCILNNSFKFIQSNFVKDAILKESNWYFEDGSSSKDSIVMKSYQNSGIYTIKLVSKNNAGCKDSISKNVEVRPKAIADYTTTDVCETDSVTFVNLSQNAERYVWKFGDGKKSNLSNGKHFYLINGLSTTFNVTLVGILSGGCSDSITKAVTVNANPKSDFSYTTNGQNVHFTALQTNGTNYQWKFGDNGTAITGQSQTTYTYSKFPSGKYNACLLVTNAANCSSLTCKVVEITGAISNLTKPMGIEIYPNPNSGNFTIDIPENKEPITIEIFNQIGQMVHKTSFSNLLFTNDFNLSKGIYMIRVTIRENILNHRVIVTN